ncbi:serine-rich adhesin for platelets-like isoform X2 [Lucilia sericata]|uniref:serine-rich adhesin for platelets-like isoform X2 n=1 Tax=Lucilia sericata TaxID=13632 RepID=UPI0018A85931|nr:serine-rich adhesin for platelets-like isoform X2 [Lucilia sericata]
MDFISNLIKRPISLVINETSNTMDKYSNSDSLPNANASELNNQKDSNTTTTTSANGEQQSNLENNNKYSPNMSSSLNGSDHMTDFIGVPDEYLDEFKDILPPPPLNLQHTDCLTQSLLDLDNTRPLSITPPPPPHPSQLEPEEMLTSSMKASQTIDELLSHINDNLQQAGLNDEVLAIASPSNKSELSPLSSKAALNNSKLLNSSSSASNIQINSNKTPTMAAGTASTNTVFENNSSIHKFHIDPELETGIFDDHQQHQQAARDQLNNSGVNKSSNKFVGLTEFDEAKIPELPGDLNPNIEEQYNVTFEECFIPTLTAQQGTKVPDEFIVDKTHLLLPTETDAISSENETFADCNDERDPLATTFAEQGPLDATTDLESYQSAVNNSLNTNLNNTMENIADITMEAEGQPLQKLIQNQAYEEITHQDIPQQFEAMDTDEPMDVDMNATMEIIHNTSNNIQHVERVLQHAENILQHIEEKKPLEDFNKENVEGLLEKQTETSKMTFVVNTPVESNAAQHLEMEQSKHELSLNKSVELPVNKTVSSECIIETVNKEVSQEDNKELQPKKTEDTASNLNITMDAMNTSTTSNSSAKSAASKQLKKTDTSFEHNLTIDNMNISSTSNSSVKAAATAPQENIDSLNNHNLTIDCMNTSTTSNSSTKSTAKADNKPETKLNLTLGLSTSQKSEKSAPTSPAFPIKPAQNTGFPRSPKAQKENPKESPFLEKSDYFSNLQTQTTTEKSLNDLNGTYIESSVATSVANNLNGTFVEPYAVDTAMPKPLHQLDTNTDELKHKRQTFSIETLSEEKTAEEKRRTFAVSTTESTASSQLMQFPSLDKPDNQRRTFAVNDTVIMPQESLSVSDKNEINARRTFNVPSTELSPEPTDQTAMDTSFEPMEVDYSVSQNTTISMTVDKEQRSQSPPLPAMQQRSQSPPLPSMQQRSQSPPLPTQQQRSQSPPLPTMQQRSQSPPLPTQQRSQSPSLPTMQQRSQSPPLPTQQQRTQSPCLPTMQQRSQSPPLPTMHPRSQSPPLPTMQPRSQSPPLPTLQQNKSKMPSTSQLPPLPTDPQVMNIKEEQISPPPFESTTTSFTSQPLSTLIQKRPSIRDARARVADILSAKEQSNIKVKDEKDIFVEKFTPSPIEDIFTAVSATSTTLTNSSGFSEFDQTSSLSSTSLMNQNEQLTRSQQQQQQQFQDEFSGNNNNLILNPSDFDYLLTKGNNTTPVDRSSLLLKFDPLLGVPVPVNQGQQQLQQLQIPTNTINPCLSPTLEEDEHNDSNRSFVIDTKATGGLGGSLATGGGIAAAGIITGTSAKLLKERSQEVKQQLQLEQQVQQNKRQLTQGVNKNATMSVDVIKDMSLDNDCNKTFENSNSTQSDDKQINYKMDELEKKIKNEVLKTEDIEKKLKDAEQREEALIKRITEKDKTIAKMTGVIEAYEKAIAELIADKEQLTQHYEKQLAEVKADRDSNYHHLTSLETTFSDLHVKYEKSKEMTCQLKESEEALQAEKRKNLENLHLQEQRYDKMKNHAMQQLEIANKKLESLTRDHSIEITKLKALLKKEEIARSSIHEQLAQKTKENAELVKICDELISGQGS